LFESEKYNHLGLLYHVSQLTAKTRGNVGIVLWNGLQINNSILRNCV